MSPLYVHNEIVWNQNIYWESVKASLENGKDISKERLKLQEWIDAGDSIHKRYNKHVYSFGYSLEKIFI